MKKSKLITCLSAAFISAMALMSCSSMLKGRKNIILTIDGVPYTADQLFNDQKTPAAAEAKFNGVYKAAIRTYYLKDHPGYSDMSEINRDVKVKIKELKATAQSNASKNGTSYATEWKKILTENGVSSSSELNDKVEYDFQKEKFENKFYDKYYDVLKNNHVEGKEQVFPFTDENKFVDYFKGKQPYHMKHILVKIANLGDNNTDGTITKEEAKKLYDVITSLANGTSFSQVSKSFNDDETARNNGGSLGIMSRDTSFVDDFKLGTYFYEAFYGSSTNQTTPDVVYKSKFAKTELFGNEGSGYKDGTAGAYATDIKKNLADPTSSVEGKEEALGVIPYGAVLKLDTKDKNGYGDYEFEDSTILKQAGIDKSDFNDKYLPRNVIFNKFFNKHNLMVIAPVDMDSNQLTYGTTYEAKTNILQDATGKGCYRSEIEPNVPTANTDYLTYDGFKRTGADTKNKDYVLTTSGSKLAVAIGEDPASQHVLRDDKGRIILVFRSGTGGSSSNDDSGYQGIHFIVIERSPFIGIEYDDGEEKIENKHSTSLDDYYTVFYPGQPGGEHPKYDDELKKDKKTFANYIEYDELKNKKDRADKVKTELKNCMPNLNTYIYEHLLKVSDIHFKNTPEAAAINSTITDWISATRDDSEIEKNHSWNNNWQNYCYSLKAKAELRADTLISTNHYESRVVSQLCINAITDTNFVIAAGATGVDKITAIEHMFGVGGVFHE